MGDETLKPCPFCGVSNTHTANGWLDGRHNEEEWWQVECQECCAAGPSRPFEYQATEAWNNAGAATARAEALEREVAQARAEGAATERARIAAEIAALATEPDSTGQVLAPRCSPATLAALREVARRVASGDRD